MERKLKIGDYLILLPASGTVERFYGACGRVIECREHGDWVKCELLSEVETFEHGFFYMSADQPYKLITEEQARNPNFSKFIKVSYDGN